MVDIFYLMSYLEHISYFWMLIAFMLAGYIIPLPEEIVLIIAGYLAAVGYTNLYTTIFVAIAGLFIGDCIIYKLSKHGSKIILKIKEKLLQEKVDKFSKLLEEHEGKTIFITRFIIGLRIMGPILAGSHKTNFAKFIFFNILAILIYAPLLVLLGYHFHNQILIFVSKIMAVRHSIAVAIWIILGYLIVRYVHKKYLEHNGAKKV